MRKFPLVIVALSLIAVALTWTGLAEGWKPLKFNLGADIGGKLGTFVFLALLVERSVEVIMTLWRGHEADSLELEVNQFNDAVSSTESAARVEALARIKDADKTQAVASLSLAASTEQSARIARAAAVDAAELVRRNPADPNRASQLQTAEAQATQLEKAARIACDAANDEVAKVLGQALKAKRDELLRFRSCTRQWAMPLGMLLGCILASFGARILLTFIDAASIPTGTHQAAVLEVADILITAIVLAGGSDPIHKLMDLYRKFMESSSAKAAAAK